MLDEPTKVELSAYWLYLLPAGSPGGPQYTAWSVMVGRVCRYAIFNEFIRFRSSTDGGNS